MNAEALRRHPFRRILLIKLSAVGDVVHAIPVLHRLRDRYPEARIDWLIKSSLVDLIRDHPALDRIVPFPDEVWRQPWAKGIEPLRQTWKLISDLRSARYDLVIDLHGQSRSAFCALVTGAPVRIGFDRPRPEVRAASNRRLPDSAYQHAWAGSREGAWLAYTHPITLPTPDLHAVDRYLRVGALLGFADAPVDFSFTIAPAAVERVGSLLREHGVRANATFVALAPGTVWETKQWAADGFAAVARHFLDRGVPVALVGAGKDRIACEAVALAAPGVANLCGRTTLPELAALLRCAAVVVTNDSGPMHLAVALARPTVSIFGPTDSLWVGPYGRPDAVIEAGVPCAPCYLRQLRRCPHQHACMRGVVPADVIALAERMLASTALSAAASTAL